MTSEALPSATSEAQRNDDGEARRQHLQEYYAQFDARRTATRSRYNDIAWRAGRTELGAERARTIVGLLDRAGYPLRIATGPAAFSDSAAIDKEMATLAAVNALLDQAEAELNAALTGPP
jgi:hypothetical protein